MTNLTIFPPVLGPMSLYVANCLSNDVTVFQRVGNRGMQKATIPLNFQAQGLAVDRKRNRVYVTNGDQVSIIDMKTKKVLKSIPVGNQAEFPALNPTGTRLYVPNFRSDTLSVIDTMSDSVIDTIPVGSQPLRAVTNPSGSRVYVINSATNTVSVVDTTQTKQIPDTIKISPQPRGIAVDQAGRYIYVTCRYTRTVDVIDTTQQNSVVDHIPVGDSPSGIALTPDGKQLWVANNTSNNIFVLDVATRKPLRKPIRVNSPLELAISGRFVFVTEPRADRVAVIDRNTYSLIAAPTVGDEPEGVWAA